MRMSCNGCRVLRKGCSEDCIIRPCLDWIKNPESQANATVLLAKFYGRAGLLNLLTAVPLHQRPCVFRSLLYESCGRMVNPIYGSVGLLWSGKWHLCQAAVDAVLRGTPIVPVSSTSAGPPQLMCFDIRHVAKAKSTLHNVINSTHFKRSAKKNVTSTTTPIFDHQSWQQQLVHKTMLSFESPVTTTTVDVDNDYLELTLGTNSPSKSDDVSDTCS